MSLLNSRLKTQPIIYVTRDIERALGLSLDTSGFFIISNKTPLAKEIAQHRGNVLLIDEEKILDTWELLAVKHENIQAVKHIVVFKNTPKIERLCNEQNIHLLNPSAKLAAQVEEKISQVAWLGELETYLPPHSIETLKDVVWNGDAFILQFNRAHTGSGTFKISSEKELKELQKQFPERPARISAYVEGPAFTCNVIVGKDAILTSTLSYQITGFSPFTDEPFATVGNDWKLPKTLLSYEQKAKIYEIAHAIGTKLQKEGWRGAFGIDVIQEEKTGDIYLIEINARQPASVTYESQLQQKFRAKGNTNLLTTFEAHLLALLDESLEGKKLVPVIDGAQIILRNTQQRMYNIQNIVEELTSLDLHILHYDNTKPGSDLLRIQSEEGLMKNHNQFNEKGHDVKQLIEHRSNGLNR